MKHTDKGQTEQGNKGSKQEKKDSNKDERKKNKGEQEREEAALPPRERKHEVSKKDKERLEEIIKIKEKIDMLLEKMERMHQAPRSEDEKRTDKQIKSPKKLNVAVSKAQTELTEDVLAAEGQAKWEDYDLKREILLGIQYKGFSWPSPIQAASIPHSLKGEDIVARAKNGTGKAAAFIIPLLNKIKPQKSALQALVLVPTRELVLQTIKVFREIGQGVRVKMFPLYGGFSPKDDIIRLRSGAQIIVGTPGRVLDFIEQGVISLEHCEHLVCDEADKLLSKEFKEVLYRVSGLLPKHRQIELYSATFPCTVQEYISRYMKNPVKINLMKELTLTGVKQYYAYVKPSNKLHCLKTLLNTLDLNQCFIFCNSIATVEKLAQRITEIGFTSYFIHSKMRQEDRNMAFHNFSTRGECRILVSTDLVTRGIDVPSVNVVINFDLPCTTESYLHRIGRSGRFGTRGIAINMVAPEERGRLQQIEAELGIELLPFSN